MQVQICPRCKFRLTSAKAICNTCGYAFQAGRKPETATASIVTSPKPMIQSQAISKPSSPSPRNVGSTPSGTHKTQTNAATGAKSFWRTFFGLDPLPSEKSDRDEHALGET